MSARRKAPLSLRASGNWPAGRKSGLVVFCALSDGVPALGRFGSFIYLMRYTMYGERGSVLGLNEALFGGSVDVQRLRV